MVYEEPRNGDIRATLALSQAEARTGSSRTLNLPGGRQITVPVRAGIYNGEEIRLRGQGEPAWDGGPTGDLILTVAIAPAEQFGSQQNLAGGFGSPTEFTHAPTLSSPISSPNYPPPPAGSSGSSAPGYPNYTNYPPAGQRGDFSNYPAEAQGQDPLFLSQTQSPYADPAQYAGYQPPAQYVPPPYIPPAPKRRGFSLLVTILILILVLLLIGGSALVYYAAVYQPQLRVQATATAQGQLTGTVQAQITGTAQANDQATAQALATAKAQANATGTAVASATAVAKATATALQGVLSTATSGSATLTDPLNAQDSNTWDAFASDGSGGSCTFSGGAYHSVMTQKGFFRPCYSKVLTYSNFALQVQMNITQGDEGGILFRADDANSKFYLFRISQNGAYDLYLYVDSSGTHAKNLLSGSSTLINTGTNQTNVITVIARGGNLYFYVNQKYLDSASNNMYASGKIGVFGESNTNSTDVAFSNLQVWKL